MCGSHRGGLHRDSQRPRHHLTSPVGDTRNSSTSISVSISIAYELEPPGSRNARRLRRSGASRLKGRTPHQPVIEWTIRHPQQGPDGHLETWQRALDDVPQDVHVDPEVLVDEDIAEARDLLPVDVGLSRSKLGRQLPDRSANHLEVAHDASSVFSSAAKACFESPRVYRLILPIAPEMSSR